MFYRLSQQDSCLPDFFWWQKQPSSHILSPSLKLPQRHRVLCSPDAETSISAPHGTCYGASVFLLPPRWNAVSTSLREFMGSDKRCRENTRQPVREAAVCDSFPHFIHMLWLILSLGCRHSYKSWIFNTGASEHASSLMHHSNRCGNLSDLPWVHLWWTGTFSFLAKRSTPGM